MNRVPAHPPYIQQTTSSESGIAMINLTSRARCGLQMLAIILTVASVLSACNSTHKAAPAITTGHGDAAAATAALSPATATTTLCTHRRPS
jgi:hypothetical protein